ncbi:MAG: FAD-binding oxidoreductase [Candidatus Aminicenantes bacterium]|nr:FAD-binding oxidoreductase [Candidatus Aminicenantes bacterium]
MAATKSATDVIIIGSGSVGTPAALAMAESGLRVLVLDRMPSVGQGSNKGAIGGIRATHSDPAKIRICLRSLEIFSTWKERRGDDIEWHKGGYMFVAYRNREEKALRELLVTQKAFGLNIDWLDRSQMLDLVPDLNPESLIGGTFSPDDGSASPLLSAHAFWKAAEKAGAKFRFGEIVMGLIMENGSVRGVRTDKGEYHAAVVVNAAGGWAAEVGRMAGLDLPVKPDAHEGAVTEPVAPFLKPMVVDIRPTDSSVNYYFFQHSTGQIIFCITPNPSIWGLETRETSSFLPMVAHRMVSLIPRLQNLRVRRTWRNVYPMTPDGFPLVGWAREVKGLLLAVGMCGQGFMLGPGLGELLAHVVNDTLPTKDREIMGLLSPYRKFEGQEKLK